ncbi:MAG: hypothetical protein M3R49_11870 [Chloroflexota bacterium]|nr:hypothetical protein [Chloroflexota bacterium]
MTNRTLHLSLLRSAIASALLLMLVAVGATAAASPVSLDVRPLLGGRFQSGGWLAVAVKLTNDGPPVAGNLVAATSDGTARRPVELPAGARKQVTLYVRPQPFQRKLEVRFEQHGTVLAKADAALQVLDASSSAQVVIVGDGGGSLRAQLLSRGAGLPEPISLLPADLPERPEPLAGVEVIVWAADSTALNPAQRRSLQRWVAAGGELIVLGGPDWQARSEAFSDLLPVSGLHAVDGATATGLGGWVGAAVPAGKVTAASGKLAAGAFVLAPLQGKGGEPLLAAISRGAGRVLYFAVDLGTDQFRAWDGGPLLWSRLVPEDQFSAPGGGFPGQDAANSMTQALASLPSLDVPPAELLLAVIVGYILLIGPISYLVLRRFDRRELAWMTAPLLVIVFSACSYGIGNSLKGSEVILNQINVVRVAAGGSAASVEAYAGLFSPNRATYDLTVRTDALLATLNTSQFQPQPQTNQLAYVTDQGNPAHLRGLEVSVFGFQSVRADAVVDYRPSLQVKWRVLERGIEGTVTNIGSVEIEDVAVIGQTTGTMIGNLKPGASKDFSGTLTNVNGGSVSDQVYGVNNFDPSVQSDRSLVARRSVIDSLVGFGGGWPGKGGVSSSLGLDSGPFVLGWRADPGPLEVTVDGRIVQRYDQTVEVISGRPTFGPGPVKIEPAQISTRIVSTAGDASVQQPGFVSLGNGEVVFSLALPLEASGLAPTKVTLVTAPDPSIILGNQADAGIFLPPGFKLSVRDPSSGEWVTLGDLSKSSRFEIKDPTTVLDSAGTIELRITGTGIDRSFGQTTIFVGARVDGVITR